jgi:hypothetical protein
MTRLTKAVTIALALAGLAASPFAFAQDKPDARQPEPPASQQDMQDMMGGKQEDGGMGMMPMMKMMTQMNEMMGTCNKMMQAMMSQTDGAADEGEPN